jgi:hypothetical protein
VSTIKYIFKKVKLKDKEKIQKIIEKEIDHYDINAFHGVLVFHELYNNSYYNNYCWPDVKLIFLKKSMIIRIDCNGNGFDYSKYTKPSKDKAKSILLEESGRGIMIVEKISTRLIYNKKGNNVIVQLKEQKEEEDEKG